MPSNQTNIFIDIFTKEEKKMNFSLLLMQILTHIVSFYENGWGWLVGYFGFMAYQAL